MKTHMRRNGVSFRFRVQLCKHMMPRDVTPCDSGGTSLGMNGNMGSTAEQQSGGHPEDLVVPQN